jgi:hypothetical protein
MDQILTLLINSYDHDPAYQWNKLRPISRYHKTKLEKQFLKTWLPKLTITAYQTPQITVTYRAHSINNKTGDGSIARFKAKEGWEELAPGYRKNWGQNIWNEEHCLIVRLPLADEINEPYYEEPQHFSADGGWQYATVHDPGLQSRIISDCWIPSLSASTDGENIYFDWKALFNTLFREEMLMRYVTESFLAKAPRLYYDTDPARIRSRVLRLLRTSVQVWRRVILSYYRDHIANQPNTPFVVIEDWLELKLGKGMEKMRRPPPSMTGDLSILRMLMEEESMVFAMSGEGLDWRQLDEEEVKRLREEERKWWYLFEMGFMRQRNHYFMCMGG